MTVPSKTADEPIRFGAFELDARSGELRRDGQSALLAEQPLRLLLALLDCPGQVVTRDQLRRQLWGDDTFVDYEHGLNAAAKRLRDALGDSADVPRYIETVPRRGYRLIALVAAPQTADDADVTPLDAVPPPRGAPYPRRRVLRLSTAAVGAVGASLAAAWLWGGTAPAPRSNGHGEARPRLTFGDGLQTDATWSPDGTRIAYAADRSGDLDIWVQAIDGGEPVSIASSPAPDSQPAWSPTNDQIVFRSERDGGGLFLVSASGGPARRLTTFGGRPAWHPDGNRVLFSSTENAGRVASMFSVVPDGATPPVEVLAEFLRDGSWFCLSPRPDGRMMAIGQHRDQGFGIFSVELDGRVDSVARPPASLRAGLGLDKPHPTMRGQWSAGGAALFLEVTSNELSSIWRVPAREYELRWLEAELLTPGPGNAAAMSLSPDGGRLAFTSYQRRSRAWVFPFDPVAGRLGEPGRPVTDADTTVGHLSFLPGGRSIVYTAWHAGRRQSDVLVTDVQTGATRVVASHARKASGSLDGQSVSYMLERPRAGGHDQADRRDQDERAVPGVEYAAAVRDASGSERLVSAWSGDELALLGRWSGDGRTALASYWAPYPTGPVSLVLWPLDQGPARTPVRVVLSDPRRRFWQSTLSPDERFVSFVAEHIDRPGYLELGVREVAGQPHARWRQLATDHTWADKPRWAPDGRTLYFISRKPTGYFNVWGIRIDTATGAPTSKPFLITHFDSPALAIDPQIDTSEIDISDTAIALTMVEATGSIWMMSDLGR